MGEISSALGSVAISGYQSIKAENKVSGGQVGKKGNVNPVERYSKQRDGKKQRFCSPECQRKWLAEAHKGKAYLLRRCCHIPKEEWRLAYFAGLLDGEGNIAMKHSDYRIRIGNTDISMINWLTENFGGRVQRERKRNKNWKVLLRWEANSIADCAEICEAVLPYLTTKREQVSALLKKCQKYLSEFKGEIRCVS